MKTGITIKSFYLKRKILIVVYCFCLYRLYVCRFKHMGLEITNNFIVTNGNIHICHQHNNIQPVLHKGLSK